MSECRELNETNVPSGSLTDPDEQGRGAEGCAEGGANAGWGESEV
jgi:hypothetical protein